MADATQELITVQNEKLKALPVAVEKEASSTLVPLRDVASAGSVDLETTKKHNSKTSNTTDSVDKRAITKESSDTYVSDEIDEKLTTGNNFGVTSEDNLPANNSPKNNSSTTNKNRGKGSDIGFLPISKN